jgi:hypothetical protein
MTDQVTKRFDRMDENLSKHAAPAHVAVMDDMSGTMSLKNDRALHRSDPSFYSGLQN